MKPALRAAAALLPLLVLLAALAARFLGPEAVRIAFLRAAEETIGRNLRYEDFQVGFFPPSLFLLRPAVAGESKDAPAFVAARNVSLRVALLPLLAGAFVLDSVVIDGAVLNIERAENRIARSRESPPSAPMQESELPAAAGAVSSRRSLTVLGVEVRDGTIVFVDHTFSPAFEWRLQGIAGRAEMKSAEGSLEFEFAMVAPTGGSIEARGTVTFAGELDSVVTFKELALGAAAPYLARAAETEEGLVLEGLVSGSVETRGAAASPELVFDLTVREGFLGLDEIELSGELLIAAALSGRLERTEGNFEIDATAAEIRYGGVFTKPAGTPAYVSGRIVSRGGAHSVEDIRLKIVNPTR